MKKLSLPILLVITSVVVLGSLILFLNRDKLLKNERSTPQNNPTIEELSEDTKMFLKEIGTTAEQSSLITIENSLYTAESGTFLLSSDQAKNKIVFVNTSDTETQIYIYEQPEGSTLPIGYILNPHGSLATTISQPGIYRFSFLDNTEDSYSLFVTNE
jgi:hypothetical protein